MWDDCPFYEIITVCTSATRNPYCELNQSGSDKMFMEKGARHNVLMKLIFLECFLSWFDMTSNLDAKHKFSLNLISTVILFYIYILNKKNIDTANKIPCLTILNGIVRKMKVFKNTLC